MHETNISAWQALMDAVGGWICQGKNALDIHKWKEEVPPLPPGTTPPLTSCRPPPLPIFQRR